MNQESLVELYREVFPEAARLIKRLGGNLEEAKDAFHDALLIHLEREAKGTLQVRTSAKAYLIGITKILWLHSKNQYFASCLVLTTPTFQTTYKPYLQTLLSILPKPSSHLYPQ